MSLLGQARQCTQLFHDIMIFSTTFVFNKQNLGPLSQNSIHLQQTHSGPTITKLHSSSTNTFWAHYYKTAFVFNKHIFGPTLTKQHSSSTNTFWAHYYKTAFIFNKHILGPLLQNCIHLQQTHFGPYYRNTPSIMGEGEAIS